MTLNWKETRTVPQATVKVPAPQGSSTLRSRGLRDMEYSGGGCHGLASPGTKTGSGSQVTRSVQEAQEAGRRDWRQLRGLDRREGTLPGPDQQELTFSPAFSLGTRLVSARVPLPAAGC